MKNIAVNIFVITMAVLVSSACENGNEYYSGFEQSIIVEGSIETNRYPKVFLTRNIPYYIQMDSADVIYLMLRQAKVTVSDDEQSEILTLKYENTSFPPFYYEGSKIKGVPGKTYKLLVEYGEKVLTAATTIPQTVTADSAWFHADNPGDSTGILQVRIQDPPGKNYYRTFTQVRSQQVQFYATLISNFDDNLFDGKSFTFNLSKGPETYLDVNNSKFEFYKGDTIMVKLSAIDEASFAFWKSWQNEIANGANPFASSYHKIESNITGEGKGVWSGYGSTVYEVIAK